MVAWAAMGIGDLFNDRELFEQTAAAIVGSGAAIAGSKLGLQPNAITAIQIVLPMLSLGVGRGAFDLMAKRLPAFTRGYLRGADSDQAKAEAKVSQQAAEENPNQPDTMFRAFRMMMDAVDEEAVAAIGTLTFQYNDRKLRPDAHFRALGRLLCDLEPGELETLTTTLTAVQTAIGGMLTTQDSVHISLSQEGKLEVSGEDGAEERQIGNSYEFYLFGPRLFMLLTRDGLASNAHSQVYDSSSPRITLDTEALRRILATLDPSTIEYK